MIILLRWFTFIRRKPPIYFYIGITSKRQCTFTCIDNRASLNLKFSIINNERSNLALVWFKYSKSILLSAELYKNYKDGNNFSFCNKSYSKYKYVTHVFVAFLSKDNIDSRFKARTMLIPLRYAASQYAYQERAQYFWKSPFTLFSSRHFKTQDTTYGLNVSSVFQVRVINATINRSFSQLTEVYVNCNLVKSNINQIVVSIIN